MSLRAGEQFSLAPLLLLGTMGWGGKAGRNVLDYPDLQGLLERFCKLEATFSILQANGSDKVPKHHKEIRFFPSDPFIYKFCLMNSQHGRNGNFKSQKRAPFFPEAEHSP